MGSFVAIGNEGQIEISGKSKMIPAGTKITFTGPVHVYPNDPDAVCGHGCKDVSAWNGHCMSSWQRCPHGFRYTESIARIIAATRGATHYET